MQGAWDLQHHQLGSRRASLQALTLAHWCADLLGQHSALPLLLVLLLSILTPACHAGTGQAHHGESRA